MTFEWNPERRAFADDHVLAVLAAGRSDGSPQRSMVRYTFGTDGRVLVSAKAYTAKWHHADRLPDVCPTVADGRSDLMLYGRAEMIDADPARAETITQIWAASSGGEMPDPAATVPTSDEPQRTVLRITPTKTLFHE